MTYWTGVRMATSARTDEDAAMAHAALPGKFYDRAAAHDALCRMVASEIEWEADHDYCAARLGRILAQLIGYPERNQAEYDGLRFQLREMLETGTRP